MSDEAYLDDSRDPNADTGSHAARFAGGVDEREPAPRVADGRRPVGSVVASRYTLTARLGHGRLGEVYEAVDRSLSDRQLGLEHHVALHLLRRRMTQETRLLQKLEASYQQPHLWAHPNVVKVRGFGCDSGQYFLVTELLEGVTLRALLDDMQGDLPSAAETFAVLRGVGDALEYAHAKGAVHCDIRLETIFVTEDWAIKVLDLLPASSPRMAPFFVEDVASDALATPDPRDDVYGLACVAYELLSGSHPFGGRSPREALKAGLAPAPIPRIDARQLDALRRALALRREQRTVSVAEFLAELGVTGHETLHALRETTQSAAPSDLPVIGDHSADVEASDSGSRTSAMGRISTGRGAGDRDAVAHRSGRCPPARTSCDVERIAKDELWNLGSARRGARHCRLLEPRGAPKLRRELDRQRRYAHRRLRAKRCASAIRSHVGSGRSRCAGRGRQTARISRVGANTARRRSTGCGAERERARGA